MHSVVSFIHGLATTAVNDPNSLSQDELHNYELNSFQATSYKSFMLHRA